MCRAEKARTVLLLPVTLIALATTLICPVSRAAEQQDLMSLDEEVNAVREIASITIKGVSKPDRATIRKAVRSKVGEPLNQQTLQQDRERIEKMEEFVVASVETKPAPVPGQKVKTTFYVYYQNVDLELAVNNSGGVSVKLGPDQLLEPAEKYPRVGLFRGTWEEDEKPDKPYEWAREGEKTYDAHTHTFKAKHEWGGYTVAYVPKDDRLDLTIKVRNAMDSPIHNLKIYLSQNFNFPSRPRGYWWKHNRVMTPNPEKAPPVVFGDYGQGAVAACLIGEIDDTRFGFRDKRRLAVEIENLPAGKTRTVRGSVRFGLGRAARGDPHALVEDVYREFRAENPRPFEWSDRRPIGALHPSSSAKGLFKAGNPKNPRGWKLGGGKVDLSTEKGRDRFKEQALAWARNCVKVCKGMNAQGVIVWSIEGQQYPHAISYIGSPNKIGRFAPEMDAVADEFFKIFSDAGLRTGVCIRPQKLAIPDEVPKSDKIKPRQKQLWDGDRIPVEDIIEVLDGKLTYAKERWGCMIFYVDSNVSSKWAKDEKTGKWKPVRWEVMPVDIFAELQKRHPECLIVPEHEYFMYWAYAAPLSGTPVKVQQVWPDAFAVNLMQHFKPDDPKSVRQKGKLVERGDILLFRGWYNDPRNDVIRKLYERHHKPEWHDPEVLDAR
ncbi:MAG: hypothetical protein KGZ25_09685 [Planctomycetes bacterium]|nr:hypothetical protein [Planctomycetota bacterium]